MLGEANAEVAVEDKVIQLLVTAFQDLREGVTAEGVQVERPSSVMSTAEAVSIGLAAGLDAFYYGKKRLSAEHVGRHIATAVMKDSPDDLKKLKHYFDVVVRSRGKKQGGVWGEFLKSRKWLP